MQRRHDGLADGAHREAEAGALLSLDTVYVGKLKGVGKVWQFTGCDAASSFARARLVLGEVIAAAVLAFLREVVRPTYRHVGWKLRRVLTDYGKEFKGPSRWAVSARGSATRTRSRDMRGPTDSSSGCRRRFCTSIGASRFGGSTSRVAARCKARSIVSAVLQSGADASRVSPQWPYPATVFNGAVAA